MRSFSVFWKRLQAKKIDNALLPLDIQRVLNVLKDELNGSWHSLRYME